MSKRLKTDDGEELCNKRLKTDFDEQDYDAERHAELQHILRDFYRQQQSSDYQCYKIRRGGSLTICPTKPTNSLGPSLLKEESSCSKSKTEDVINKNLEAVDEVPCVDKTSNNKSYDRPNLLSLSDDVLLIILKKLHPFDLLNVSRTCLHLNSVCRDRTLWTDIDFRHSSIDSRYMTRRVYFDDFLDFLLPFTRSIKKSGCTGTEYVESACMSSKTTQVSITPTFIQAVSVKAPNLKSFTLENHTLYAPSITLDCFSPTLEHLSFKNSIITRLPTDKSFFNRIDQLLPNIRVLDLTGCQWFDAHSFLPLSKSATLQELHLKGCLGIEDCVPYLSLAATFGFQSLEVLDLRLTNVSNSEVACFNRVKKLKRLYLEALEWPGSDRKISDLGVVSFGKERDPPSEQNRLFFIIIRDQKPSHCSLETLVLRNYSLITDISLKHAAGCLTNLKHLDVRGTCCTETGVSEFKRNRPDVELLSDFNNNLFQESIL